jgi:NADH-quinone oxidoreductase subunit A
MNPAESASLVGYLLLFVALGVFFVLFHLLLGTLVRPIKPEKEKLTIYECGEPTIGSSWIQFDLRFYVVALLFVIFDVEVAFFFPWAVVFGQANSMANEGKEPVKSARVELAERELFSPKAVTTEEQMEERPRVAHALAWFAFWDILVFFGVLLVGFAYLWKRGDIDWVRSTAAEEAAELPDKELSVV